MYNIRWLKKQLSFFPFDVIGHFHIFRFDLGFGGFDGKGVGWLLIGMKIHRTGASTNQKSWLWKGLELHDWMCEKTAPSFVFNLAPIGALFCTFWTLLKSDWSTLLSSEPPPCLDTHISIFLTPWTSHFVTSIDLHILHNLTKLNKVAEFVINFRK